MNKLENYLKEDLQERIEKVNNMIKRLEREKAEHPTSRKIQQAIDYEQGFLAASKVILADIDYYNENKKEIQK